MKKSFLFIQTLVSNAVSTSLKQQNLYWLHLLHSCNIQSYTSNVNRTLLQLQTQVYKIRKWQLSSYMQIEFDTPFSDHNTIINSMMTESFLPDPYFIWCAKRSGVDFTALLGILFYPSNIWFLHSDNPAFHLVFQHPTFQHSPFFSYWRNKLTIVNSSIHHYLGLIREG